LKGNSEISRKKIRRFDPGGNRQEVVRTPKEGGMQKEGVEEWREVQHHLLHEGEVEEFPITPNQSM